MGCESKHYFFGLRSGPFCELRGLVANGEYLKWKLDIFLPNSLPLNLLSQFLGWLHVCHDCIIVILLMIVRSREFTSGLQRCPSRVDIMHQMARPMNSVTRHVKQIYFCPLMCLCCVLPKLNLLLINECVKFEINGSECILACAVPCPKISRVSGIIYNSTWNYQRYLFLSIQSFGGGHVTTRSLTQMICSTSLPQMTV